MSGPKQGTSPTPVRLPDENTDAGAMVRLFLAEVEVPATTDMRETRRAMDWMRCVLNNRLRYPAAFAAGPDAMRVTEIIAANHPHIQFQGFEHYPHIAAEQEKNIIGKLNAADGKDSIDQRIHRMFIEAAIAAAEDPDPTDPTPDGLYFWVSLGSATPSPDASIYQDIGGNTFYTWKPRSR